MFTYSSSSATSEDTSSAGASAAASSDVSDASSAAYRQTRRWRRRGARRQAFFTAQPARHAAGFQRIRSVLVTDECQGKSQGHEGKNIQKGIGAFLGVLFNFFAVKEAEETGARREPYSGRWWPAEAAR